jgi:hypothetical protein
MDLHLVHVLEESPEDWKGKAGLLGHKTLMATCPRTGVVS